MRPPTKPETQYDRVKALEVLMQYPVGYVTIWHERIAEPSQPKPTGQLQLALTSDEAKQIGMKFLQLAQSIEQYGGTSQ